MKNELRIGNYINESNKVLSITDSGVLCTGLSMIGVVLIENPKPIPLTEEWLLKFGFEKNKSNKNRFIHYISGFEIERQGSKFAYAVWGGEDAPFLTQFFGHHNYVHQLQNLYFALTCEELTVNQ